LTGASRARGSRRGLEGLAAPWRLAPAPPLPPLTLPLLLPPPLPATKGIKFFDPEIVGDTPEAVEHTGMLNLLDAAAGHLGVAQGTPLLLPKVRAAGRLRAAGPAGAARRRHRIQAAPCSAPLRPLSACHPLKAPSRTPPPPTHPPPPHPPPQAEYAARWGALDDVVMGGVSESGLQLVQGAGEGSGPALVFRCARRGGGVGEQGTAPPAAPRGWCRRNGRLSSHASPNPCPPDPTPRGVVSTDNSGGFASIRSRNWEPPLDLGAYAGLRLRLKGNGLR
jgi:hypothetical protein